MLVAFTDFIWFHQRFKFCLAICYNLRHCIECMVHDLRLEFDHLKVRR